MVGTISDQQWDKLFPAIEKALGFTLYEWQKVFIKTGSWTASGRRNGFTLAYIIKQIVSLSGESIKARDIHKLQDGLHGVQYRAFFENFFQDIHGRLKSAGVPVIKIER